MKFRNSDRVLYKGKKANIITGWSMAGGSPKYRIEIGGKQIEVLERDLTPDDSGYFTDITPEDTDDKIGEKRCPICWREWVETKFNKIVWKDCDYCKKTKEEIMKNYKKKMTVPKKGFWS
jgi:hypothetical protein